MDWLGGKINSFFFFLPLDAVTYTADVFYLDS
jgi:hypothetical protein